VSPWLSRLRGLFARRPRASAPPAIEPTADGFALRGPDGTTVEVQWRHVRRAFACKRDRITTDEVVLALELDPPAPALLEVSEESPGFAELFGGMERALGVSPTWYLEIMVPVFEPTPRTLYERPGAPPDPPAE
jgi:hypothetical protein